MNKLIGVYGTLRRGESNHSVLGDSEFIKTIRLKGYKMYGISGFPAVVEGELNESIVIEIYRIINDQISEAIDWLEGFDRSAPNSKDNLYTIRSCKVDTEKAPIEIYTFDHAPERVIEKGPQLQSGDWCKRNGLF